MKPRSISKAIGIIVVLILLLGNAACRNSPASSTTTTTTSTSTSTSTTATAIVAPQVVTIAARNIGVYSARLNGELINKGSATTVSVSFLWGTSSGSYPYETDVQILSAATTFYFDINNLTGSTTYYYQTKVVGDSTITGNEISFTTLKEVSPRVTTLNAVNITATSARLNGSLTTVGSLTPVTVMFQWGTVSKSYTNTTKVEDMNKTGTFFLNVTGLEPNTTYYYRARAYGSTMDTGVEKSFTTLTTSAK